MIERGLVGNPESSLVHRRSPKSINQSPNSRACPYRLQSGCDLGLGLAGTRVGDKYKLGQLVLNGLSNFSAKRPNQA